MAGDQFNEQINIVVQFTQKGLAELTNQAKAALAQIAEAGVAGGVGQAGLPALQGTLRNQAAAYISAAKAQIPNLPKEEQAAARAALVDFAKTLRVTVDQLMASSRQLRVNQQVAGLQQQQALLNGTLAAPSWFQKLQAQFANRPGVPGPTRDPSSFPSIPQFVGQKALTTLGYALPATAFYGTFNAIRGAVTEANAFQVALVALEQEFKAADDAGDFPKVKQALIDISNQTGVAASEIARIAQVFKGAFGDTTKAIQETSDAVRLGVIASLPTADITNSILAIDTAFHTSAKNIGDLALSVFEQTGVGVHEIVTGLGLIAPVADEAGLSIKSTSAILAIAEQKSQRSAQAIAENFTRILPAIQKNGVAILDLIASVPGLDKEFQQLGQDLNQGQSGKFLTDLIPAFGKLNTVTQNTVIELLGGRREAGALIPVLKNGAQFADLMAKSTDNNGKSAEYFAKTMNTLSKQLSVLGSEFKNFIGDLFRSGIAAGLVDVLGLVKFIFGGLQEVEVVFKEIDKVTGGWAGKLAGAYAIYKAVGGVRSFLGGASNPLSGAALPAAAKEAGVILVAAAQEAGAALVAGGTAAGAEQAAGGAAGGAAGAAGLGLGANSGFLAGEGAGAGAGLLAGVPVLPIAGGILLGFAAYKSAVDDAKKANAAAGAEADKFTESFLKQRRGLAEAVASFASGNRQIGSIHGNASQIAGSERTNQLTQQSKDLQALSAKLIQQAQDDYLKKFKDSVSDPTPLGPTGPVIYGDSPTAARLASHLPIVGHFFNRQAKQKTPDEFAKAYERVGKDVREQLTKDVFIPFLDQYIKDAGDNAAKVLLDTKGPNAGVVVGQVRIPKFDTKGQAAAAAKAEAKLAQDQLREIKKRLGDGSNASNYAYALTYIESVENNKDTSPSVKKAFDELKNKLQQAQASAKSNETETLLDAQKQLYAAGAESASKYLGALGKQINGLLKLQDASPLSPDLKLQLAQFLKEENDVISSLADQASKDAEFLAGLTQSGPALAQTKVQLARAKFAALRNRPGQPRTQAAQDLLTAQQDAFAQSLSFLSPDQAYSEALKGYTPDPTAINVILKDEKDAIAGERAALTKQRDFYTAQLAKLDSQAETSRGKGGDTAAASAKARDYRTKLEQINTSITALDNTPVLDPTQAANKELADSQNQRALSINLIRAGDDQVKQSAAHLKAAAAQVATDKQFYGKVLPEDAAAYFVAYNDLLFQKAFAAEQEKEQAIQLKIAATRNPEVKAALEVALAKTKAAYAASIAKIPGHEEEAKKAANDAANATITGTNDTIDTANAIAKARLDLLAAMTQDPIQLARIAIQQADEEAREAAVAGDAAAQLQAAAHRLQAQHQLAQALSDARKAYSSFLIAVANFYGDGVKAAELSLQEANRELQDAVQQGLGAAEISNRAAAVVTAQRALLDASLQAKEATIDFNLQMKKISTAQAIALYTALLSTANTVQEQRDLLLKIQSLKESLNQDLQFNLPSDLKLPTLYEARRFNQGGGASGFAAGGGGQFNDNRQININVNGARDSKAVVQDVVAALNAPPRQGVRPRIY